MFYPIMALERGIPTIIIGIVLSLKPLVCLIATPILNQYLLQVGLELSILIAGLTYAACFVSYACITLIEDLSNFLVVSLLTQIFVGISESFLSVSERQVILLFSLRKGRNQTTATFQTYFGLGIMLSPIFGCGLYVIGGYMFVFFTVGLGHLLIYPYNYSKLTIFADLHEEFNRTEYNTSAGTLKLNY